MQNTSQNAKHFPESKKTLPGIQNTSQNSKTLSTCFGFWEIFLILGCVFGFWEVFWILGCVFGFWDVFLDSGKCFGCWDVFLDSGRCFWILGGVLDSGTCFGFWILDPPYRIAVKAIFVVYFCPSSLVSRQISLPLTDLVSKQIYNCLFINLIVSSD